MIPLWKGNVVSAGVLQVPEEVRMLWDRAQSRGRFNDIFEVEAIGPLVILDSYAELMRGCLWLHFIDNAGALSSLVNGSSSVREGDVIVGETWSRIQGLGVVCWFDRVDSASNPVDGLSRGRLGGPWVVDRLCFPHALLPALQRELGTGCARGRSCSHMPSAAREGGR